MFRNILIATDGSEVADKAVTHGLGLAKATGSTVTAVMVTDRFPTRSGVMMPNADDVGRYEAAAAKAAKTILDQVDAAALSQGVVCLTRHVKDNEPSDGILQACHDAGCDLIVMASHGRRGLDRFLLGSQTAKVMSAAKVPVLVCR